MDTQGLLDRQAIRDLVARYSHAVDRCAMNELSTCFTDDARLYWTGVFEFSGAATIVEGIRSTRRYESTMHVLGNETVTLHGDAATAETYCVAYHAYTNDAGAQLYVMGIRYLDELVRTDEWRIAARELAVDWTMGAPLAAPELA